MTDTERVFGSRALQELRKTVGDLLISLPIDETLNAEIVWLAFGRELTPHDVCKLRLWKPPLPDKSRFLIDPSYPDHILPRGAQPHDFRLELNAEGRPRYRRVS